MERVDGCVVFYQRGNEDTPSGSVGGTSLIGKSLQVEDKIKNDDTSCSTTSRGEDLPKNEDRQSLEADSESDSSCASRRKQNVNPFQFQGLATGSRSRENSCSSCDSREQAPNPFQFQGFVNTQPKSCSSGFRERQSLTNKKECATSASPCGDRVVSCPLSDEPAPRHLDNSPSSATPSLATCKVSEFPRTVLATPGGTDPNAEAVVRSSAPGAGRVNRWRLALVMALVSFLIAWQCVDPARV